MRGNAYERRELAERVLNSRFTITKFRIGYSLDQVDDFLDTIVAQLRDGEPATVVLDTLASASFRQTRWLDGYDTTQVDNFLQEVSKRIGDFAAEPPLNQQF